MTAQTEAKITWEDLERMPPDGMRHEIINGEHVVNAAPNLFHQDVSRNLEMILLNFVKEHRLGKIYDSPVNVLFGDGSVVDPDLVFVGNDRRSILKRKYIEGAPDLIVEILSDSTRRYDEIAKRALYERFGVTEYWLVDPDACTVKVYRRGASGSYGHPVLVTAAEDKTLTTPLLPGLTIDLAEVFAE
jgi:prepilin-type processing-associated H-X9-DG protein